MRNLETSLDRRFAYSPRQRSDTRERHSSGVMI
jgi:hypothetical protein